MQSIAYFHEGSLRSGTQPSACRNTYVCVDIPVFYFFKIDFFNITLGFFLQHVGEVLGINWWWKNVNKIFFFATDFLYYFYAHYKLLLFVQTLDSGV